MVRLGSGVVYAQLPDRFGTTDAAFNDLHWCVNNIAKAPHAGWLREVFYQLAVLHQKTGDQKQAQDYLRASGYRNFDKAITLGTGFFEIKGKISGVQPLQVHYLLGVYS